MSNPSEPNATIANANAYRAKRPWPPNLESLSSKHQFRLERRYKRRAKLKWARPTFMKVTKAVQIIAASTTAIYGVFFMDWSQGKAGFDEGAVFGPARAWAKRTFGEYRTLERRDQPIRQQTGDGKPEGG